MSVLHILDAAEVNSHFSDLTIFEGMETSEEIQVDPRAVKKTYLNEFRAWMEHLRRSLLDEQVDYPARENRSSARKLYSITGKCISMSFLSPLMLVGLVGILIPTALTF